MPKEQLAPHTVRDPLEARELVTRARRLERLMHRRRTLLRALAGVEATIRTERKFVHDMMAPLVYLKAEVNGNGATPAPDLIRDANPPKRRPGRPRKALAR